jgi:hypothetical protein
MPALPGEQNERLVLLDRLMAKQLELAQKGDIEGAVGLMDRAGELARRSTGTNLSGKDLELIERIKGSYSKLALLLTDRRNQAGKDLASLWNQRKLRAAYGGRR